jgi:V/A-type H+-transporting ATPase subunit D
MTRLRRIPPGRGGRVWLQHRLSVAERGADLLDQKARILHVEAQRLSLVAARTRAAWEDAARESSRWLDRAALLGGERAIRLAGARHDAEAAVTWAYTMGVRHPVEATCTVPAPDPAVAPATSAALVFARRAHEAALSAAVEHAAAVSAAELLAAEEAATRRRLRAVNDRWIPMLTGALADVQLALEQQEHEDDVRLRWAHEGHERTDTGTEDTT